LGQGEDERSTGLISGHAYSVISLHEISHDGETVTLLKLRNPWGKGEWKGDWSDKSPLWTPDLRRKCGSIDEEDGTYFIEFSDYLDNFALTAICVNANQNYHHNHVICDLRETPSVEFMFKIEEKIPAEDTFTIFVA